MSRRSKQGRTSVEGAPQELPARVVRAASLAGCDLRDGWTGSVHSSYARSVNLRGHVGGRSSWLTLRPATAPLPPFGLGCAPWPATAAAVGSVAWVDGTRLRVVDWGDFACGDVQVTTTRIPSPAPGPDLGRCLGAAMGASGSAFLAALGAILQGHAMGSLLGRRAADLMARLLGATRSSDTALMTSTACGLLGLGPGLTPAGDDVVAGWMSGLVASGPRGRMTLQGIGCTILRAAEGLTNDISNAFLRATVQGHIAVPLRAFVSDPGPRSVDGVLRMGATSGGDWLAGYLLARHALVREPG